MIVVDASVAVKWLLPEVGTGAANRLLRDQRRLLAPDIAAVEVAAAVTRKVRLGELDAEAATGHVEAWCAWLARGVLELVPSTGLLPAAAAWALRLGHPLQDCLYLALATGHAALLVTADATLARRASTAYGRVTLLAAD